MHLSQDKFILIASETDRCFKGLTMIALGKASMLPFKLLCNMIFDVYHQ